MDNDAFQTDPFDRGPAFALRSIALLMEDDPDPKPWNVAVATWMDVTGEGLERRGVAAQLSPAEQAALNMARAYYVAMMAERGEPIANMDALDKALDHCLASHADELEGAYDCDELVDGYDDSPGPAVLDVYANTRRTIRALCSGALEPAAYLTGFGIEA